MAGSLNDPNSEPLVPLSAFHAERRKCRWLRVILIVAVGLSLLPALAVGWWQGNQAREVRQLEAEYKAEQSRLEHARQKTDQRRARAESDRATAIRHAEERVPELIAIAANLRKAQRFKEAEWAL